MDSRRSDPRAGSNIAIGKPSAKQCLSHLRTNRVVAAQEEDGDLVAFFRCHGVAEYSARLLQRLSCGAQVPFRYAPHRRFAYSEANLYTISNNSIGRKAVNMARRCVFQVGVATVLVAGLLTFGFAASAADVTMSGSTTVLPIAQAMAEAYAGIYEIEVSGGGSGVGITNLIDGTTMICASSRTLKAEEYATAVAKGVYPMMWYVANDALSPIVHPSNPVSDLTMAQLKQIYAGEITNWSQVGGSNTPILVVSRDSSSGTYGSWNDLILKGATVTTGAVYTSSNADVANEVAGNPNAIGYVGLGYLNDSVRAVAVGGVPATVQTALDRTFPVGRPLFMVTNGFPTGPTFNVLMWILSDDGQRLVLEMGFAPVRALP